MNSSDFDKLRAILVSFILLGVFVIAACTDNPNDLADVRHEGNKIAKIYNSGECFWTQHDSDGTTTEVLFHSHGNQIGWWKARDGSVNFHWYVKGDFLYMEDGYGRETNVERARDILGDSYKEVPDMCKLSSTAYGK